MSDPLKIIHCFRAPLGGLFRHVCDLALEQSRMGHEVGIVCDSRNTGSSIEAALAKLERNCALGIHRTAMARGLGLRDYLALRFVQATVARLGGVDILHGHGAKGGAYARLAGRKLKAKKLAKRAIYTPHGGSLHYDADTFKGRVYLDLERRLAPYSDGIVFESGYSNMLYETKIGALPCPARIVPNGLQQGDFYDVILADDATDFLFIGELRHLKGVDVLLEAIAQVRASRSVTATVIGTGPDEKTFKDLAKSLSITDCIKFPGYVDAALGFVRGRCLVVPSRAESFPYIVLEAAARRIPLIVTDVGGIPEMTRDLNMDLLQPGDADALAAQMLAFLDDPLSFLERADAFRQVVANRYTIEKMAHGISDFYQELVAA